MRRNEVGWTRLKDALIRISTCLIMWLFVLAALLALNPEVIVLDEPMNGLDPKAKRFLRDLLISLHGSGKTIVCSTHDFRYVDGMFSRGVVLSEAHSIARDDAYEAILADPDFLAAHNIL